MSDTPTRFRAATRRLWKSDQAKLIQHFQRLDPETRRLRFGGIVGDAYLREYVDKIFSGDSVVFGAFPDDELRGIAELRGTLGRWPRSAEAALSVELAWQDGGIGDGLLQCLITAARNRGIKTINMQCLRENMRMRTLVRKHGADLKLDIGSVEAELTPPWPTPMSMFEEFVGYTHAAFARPK
ncbi:GNAT family N-acetyltransferase [Roseovarius sp. S1116L3]|uniref:GNAT family N-acetyltransferase n=1 Tax=Roseovarius roseus TaxID=3342636 RepID=UPI00372B7815